MHALQSCDPIQFESITHSYPQSYYVYVSGTLNMNCAPHGAQHTRFHPGLTAAGKRRVGHLSLLELVDHFAH